MVLCRSCNHTIEDGEERAFHDALLCEDCYIDAIHPKVGKMLYESDKANFMMRLKDSYIACAQRYH